MKGQVYRVLGLMSGSSLDGLDLALCRFEETGRDQWKGWIESAVTLAFPENLRKALAEAPETSALELCRTEEQFLVFCAEAIHRFPGVEKTQLISSHGHTVFHKPAEGWTLQIGNGARLHGLTGIPVVSDFRSTDVALGGQGAPLVPCAERFLFQEFTACLNLGGIANISFPQDPEAPGLDLCACNQWLNRLAERMGQAYDKDGQLSAQGKSVPELYAKLNALPYYQQTGPRSLGNEDCLLAYKNLLETQKHTVPDLLATVLAHVGYQVGKNMPANIPGTLLLTGGGAFHPGLVAAIRRNLPLGWNLEVPDNLLISFKEAYCFAFLGLRRALNRTNVFAHVTGARTDSVSGQLSGYWTK